MHTLTKVIIPNPETRLIDIIILAPSVQTTNETSQFFTIYKWNQGSNKALLRKSLKTASHQPRSITTKNRRLTASIPSGP